MPDKTQGELIRPEVVTDRPDDQTAIKRAIEELKVSQDQRDGLIARRLDRAAHKR